MSYFTEISARLAALTGAATPKVVRQELSEFDVRDIEAVRVSEGGNGGSLPLYTLEDTDGNDPNFTAVLNTAGVGCLGCYAEYFGDLLNDGGPDLYAFCLTRRPGKPWLFAAAIDAANGVAGISSMVSAASGALVDLPLIRSFAFAGLGPLSVVIANPVNEGGSPADASATTTFGNANADLTYSASTISARAVGNMVTVELVDPNATDSPLSVSSTDGWDVVVSLATDSNGDIVTTGNDLTVFLAGTLVNVTQAVFGQVVEAHGPLPLVGGDNGTPGITYRFSNES